MALNGMGWQPDLPDVRDLQLPVVTRLQMIWQWFLNLFRKTTVINQDLVSQCPPIYNQGSLGSCHDDQTEILTKNGWKLFKNIAVFDDLATVNPETKELIYEKPTRLIRFNFDGDIYYSNHQNVDFAVTPNHKMLYRIWNQKERKLNNYFSFIDAKDTGWYVGLMTEINFKGKSQQFITLPGVEHKHKPQRQAKDIPINLWLNLLGIYLAEGTIIKSNKPHYKIQLAASKAREKDFIRNLLFKLKLNAQELEDRFTFNNKQIYKALESLGLKGIKAPYKFVPEFVFELDPSLIKEFLLGHFMGDGCEQYNMRSFYTSSEKLANDIQRLIFLSGKWSTINKREARTSIMKDGRIVRGRYPEYRVSEWKKNTLSLERKENIYKKYYSGEVFCAEVPTYHTLVTRRNGRILISGNCVANATGALFQFIKQKDYSKYFMPSRLFNYYNSRILINTVNVDSGAYIRDSMKVLNKQGACKEETWTYNVSKFTIKPDEPSYTEALENQSIKYMRVNRSLADFQKCITDGYPFVFGFTVYESFESAEVAKTGIVSMPKPNEKAVGGHAVMAVGFDVEKKMFLIRNSWGASWGLKGYFWMPFEYLMNSNLSDDFWTLRQVE